MTFEKMTRGIRFSATQGYFSHIKKEERMRTNEQKFKFGKKAIDNCEWLQGVVNNS
jgi:hypothetical protein